MVNYKKIAIFITSLALISKSLLAIENTKEIYLAPGEQELISFQKLSSIAIGNRNIIDVKFPKNQKNILLIAKSAGISSLILWEESANMASYLIRVISPALKGLFLETQKSLSDIEGVEVKILGEKLVIEGSVYKASDKKKIANIANASGQIIDLARINIEMLPLTASLIKKGLFENGYNDINVSPMGEKIFLSGEVRKKDDIDRVLEISKAIFPDISHALEISIDMEKMILIDLKITEIRKNLSKTLGVKWQNNVEFKTNFSKSTGAPTVGTFSLGEGFNSTLNLLETKGLIRILANPKLVCKNGRKSTFQAGGEIPIRLIGENNSNVIFKNYGLILELIPKIDRSDNISIEINSEVSDINTATSVEGIPGFLKNSFDTAINIHAGETLILAGLIENKASKNVDKLPFLGHIPILGELFKSRSFNNNESQFAVFITPTLINPDSKENTNDLKDIKDNLDEAKEKLKVHILD